jgi:hypothetical protein
MELERDRRQGREMRITRRSWIPLGVVVAVALGGVGAAVAANDGGDEADERVIGPSADRAGRAALREVPGGRVTAVERDADPGAAWEVEVVRRDGTVVDVELDRSLRATEQDVDEPERDGSREDEPDDEPDDDGSDDGD